MKVEIKILEELAKEIKVYIPSEESVKTLIQDMIGDFLEDTMIKLKE